jgi:hypothetical protein
MPCRCPATLKVVTAMADLSPAAQAVLNAAVAVNDLVCTDSIAAALRAAAEECAGLPDGSDCTNLLTEIAAELEGSNG